MKYEFVVCFYKVSFTKIYKMKFSLTKLRAAFGDIRAMEKLHVDTYTEDIINDIENEPFALSETNVMYAGLSELAGYHYLNTVIVGSFNIKTINGAQLKIEGDDYSLQLKSDMVELESDFSNVSNRSMTKIDFEIEAEDVPKIVKSKIKSLTLTAKKNKAIFTIVEIKTEEN
jgi:hypothetical protein